MEGKRTPIHSKPVENQQKPTDSRQKFLIPRSGSSKKLDTNATLCSYRGNNISVMGPSKSSNPKARRNLNITLSCAAPPVIKSTIHPVVNDSDLAYDIAYNDYLQAVMKQQLVKKTIEDHEIKLNDQILIECEHLHKLETTFKDVSYQIKCLNEQSDIAELLQMLKYGEQEIETLCSTYDTYNQLNKLNKILVKESDLVRVKDIKLINSQEEYDKLISSLLHLKVVMEKIMRRVPNFKEVNELASSIRSFNDLNNMVKDAMEKLNISNKKTAGLILKQTSDYFAQKGGYF